VSTRKIDWYRLLPYYWIQNKPTDWEWDEFLNTLMDNHKVDVLCGYRAKIGGYTVWIENWPYSYGDFYGKEGKCGNGLPSVKTRKRLRKMVKEAKKSQFTQTWKEKDNG
jgi:hypothetical protein|tara:strand:+ start:2038 stop:2364 length:327 start_codon:yes stop_codon:yes gene_type:complete